MKRKQSILEDFGEIPNISMKDITYPSQKYIHFWDFMDLDFEVYRLQARIGLAIGDLKKDVQKRYREYYTHTMIQTPEKFTRHNRDLQEIEYLLENPFFLALLHFALTKKIEETTLQSKALSYKKRLMRKRMDIKENLEKDLATSNELLVK